LAVNETAIDLKAIAS